METVLSHLTVTSAIAAPVAYAALRVATGSFFVISGAHKLFNRDRHATLVSTLKVCGIPFVPFMQWFVPGVEFAAGLGVATGTLTPLAALGLLAICIVATCTDGLKRIPAWHPIDKADYVDDVLYLPEVIYAAVLLLFVTYGGGLFSLDTLALALLR